ncbi:MAG: 3-hydroxyacyl-ACP dehydratase FabZ family protein [Chitinivibrionales bacterium]
MSKTLFSRDDILSLLPHRPPFLFVDKVTRFSCDRMIECEWYIEENACWFEGHFPQKPILPGVLATDALAQTSGLLWGFSKKEHGDDSDQPQIFYLANVQMKYVSPALPGETLVMNAVVERSFGSLYTYEVDACVGRKHIAKGNLTLAMMKGNL